MTTQHHADAINALAARLLPYGFSPEEASTVATSFIRDLVAHGWAPTRVVEPRGSHKPADPARTTALLAEFRKTRPQSQETK